MDCGEQDLSHAPRSLSFGLLGLAKEDKQRMHMQHGRTVRSFSRLTDDSFRCDADLPNGSRVDEKFSRSLLHALGEGRIPGVGRVSAQPQQPYRANQARHLGAQWGQRA